MKTRICLMWDALHLVGVLLVLMFPYWTSIIGLILGLMWKNQYQIARNIMCYLLWWSVVSVHGFKFGIISTITLFLSSPRIFNELWNNTLTVHCAWILNVIYPILHCNESKLEECTLKKRNVSDVPSVSIILCNKDESMETLKQFVASVVLAKTYAERKLGIAHIRLVLADGGSKNVQDIGNIYDAVFDSIQVIPGGKLCGRHECSVRETSDIIIAYDSDRKYDIRNTYEHLHPFLEDWKYCRENKITPLVGTTHYVYSDGIFPFNGGNSAYLRDVYLRHPFNTKISQTTTSCIWKEEELDWGRNLVKCGRVVSVKAIYTDINPLPFIPFLKRMLNLKNSFSGGIDRWSSEETSFVIIAKIIFISVFSVLLPTSV